MAKPVTLYIAMSLDGMIAGENDSLEFLTMADNPTVEGGEDYGYKEFVNSVDTILWGRKTFDVVSGFGGELPYKDKAVYVLSKSRQGKHQHIEFHGDAVALVSRLRRADGLGVYCDGGGEVVSALLNAGLIDNIIITVIPIILGKGTRLFPSVEQSVVLQHVGTTTFAKGIVQLRYTVVR